MDDEEIKQYKLTTENGEELDTSKSYTGWASAQYPNNDLYAGEYENGVSFILPQKTSRKDSFLSLKPL